MVSAAKYARAERELKVCRPYGVGAQQFFEKAEVKGTPRHAKTLASFLNRSTLFLRLYRRRRRERTADHCRLFWSWPVRGRALFHRSHLQGRHCRKPQHQGGHHWRQGSQHFAEVTNHNKKKQLNNISLNHLEWKKLINSQGFSKFWFDRLKLVKLWFFKAQNLGFSGLNYYIFQLIGLQIISNLKNWLKMIVKDQNNLK